MIMNRIWAMPNKYTFQILPIKSLLQHYVGDGKGWIDPFAGYNSPAEFTNDLNPKCPAKSHVDAIEFANNFHRLAEGVLHDPPYSLRQIKECYDAIGAKLPFELTQTQFSTVKDILTQKIKVGGYAISCGWNTNGYGKNRGFEMIEILLVPHGGHHNDTIVTVERKL